MLKRPFDADLLNSWIEEVRRWEVGGKVGRWLGIDPRYKGTRADRAVMVYPLSVAPTVLFLKDCLRAGVMPKWVIPRDGRYAGFRRVRQICVVLKRDDGCQAWFHAGSDGLFTIIDKDRVIRFPITFSARGIDIPVVSLNSGLPEVDEPVVVSAREGACR